jgi:hypothetical protein
MREWERTRPVGTLANARRIEAARHRAEFTQAERRRIFRQMVVAELEQGLLRYSRRRELLRYAEEIGVPSFDANLLIAEAQYRAKQLEPIELDTRSDFPLPPFEPEARSGTLTPGFQLMLALLVAAIIDLMLIVWLIG